MLPIIDFARFGSGGPAERRALAEEIGAACESVGFLYVRNHGVAPQTIEAALTAARTFFALPEEEKRAIERPTGRYRGYIPAIPFSANRGGRPPVRYEAFIQGLEIAPDDPVVAASGGICWPNLWPSRPAGFRPAMLAYWDALTALSGQLLRAFALALGQEEERLLGCFTKPLTNISLLHYPARPTDLADAEDDARAHHDTNALTILLPGETGGLQVQAPDGGWIEAPPLPGCFVVNIGNMMECWSGGRFRSTLHRVHPPLGIDRYSMAYFAVPDHDTLVAALAGTEQPGRPCRPIHAGRDLADFVAKFD